MLTKWKIAWKIDGQKSKSKYFLIYGYLKNVPDGNNPALKVLHFSLPISQYPPSPP